MDIAFASFKHRKLYDVTVVVYAWQMRIHTHAHTHTHKSELTAPWGSHSQKGWYQLPKPHHSKQLSP